MPVNPVFIKTNEFKRRNLPKFHYHENWIFIDNLKLARHRLAQRTNIPWRNAPLLRVSKQKNTIHLRYISKSIE